MGKVSKIALIIFILILTITFTIVAEENKKAKLKELQKEILNNAENIKSSEPNVTKSTQLLAALPEPDEKPAVAVLKVPDKTGERTETRSTVVSQGATDMLITALKRSRQFRILDRIINNNVMQEQNLQKNNLLAEGENPDLNKLSGADYFITGAVTEYQVEKKTGGKGITIGGLGGST